jgi:raffinose/stachyose/melibiose transport system substrate-binding protein
MLLMRVLGKEGLTDVCAGKNGGFHNPDAVKAFQLYKELAALQPFQKGFLAATYPDAAGTFHDGKTAFHLMGNWDLTEGRSDAADGKGLPDEKIGWFFFPEVKGGKGKANDIFASVDGWLVTSDAPKETVDFIKVWLGKEIQTKLAAAGLFIPMVKGTAEAIQSPLFKPLAEEVAKSDWIELAMDQLLGSDTGLVFNDESAAVAAGSASAEDATKAIETALERNKP